MLIRLLTWCTAGAFTIVGVALSIAAALRPYEDNQQNWLTLLAAASFGLAMAVIVGAFAANRGGLKALVRMGARRIASEWRRSPSDRGA